MPVKLTSSTLKGDAMAYTGMLNCSANPSFPATSAAATYLVTSAGRVGGADGIFVNRGDVLSTSGASSAGVFSAVGKNWTVTPATTFTDVAALLANSSLPGLTIEDLGIVASGSNPRLGIGTLTAGVATVTTSAVATDSVIFLSPIVNSLTSPIYTSSITNGVTFAVSSVSSGAAGSFNWMIADPQ